MCEVKKKIFIPLVVFLIGTCLAGLIVYKTNLHEKENKLTITQLNATTYGERIKQEISDGIEIAHTLQQLLIDENGTINKFDTIANNLMNDSVESIQLAPNGVVTDIYPEEGNEAGKIDLLNDKERGKISCYARDDHILITQGPFELEQGGEGIAVRNPVYLEDGTGQEYFWGFTIVILRVPDVFSGSLSAVSEFGYEYRLSKTVAPWDDTYEIVSQSDDKLTSPISYGFTIGEEKWKFELMPKEGWENKKSVILLGGILSVIVLLLTGLTFAILKYRENKIKFQTLANMDALTNIYNRYGFDTLAERMITKNPRNHYIAALLDVDDFKLINDVYGHTYGDRALKNLADSMKKFFPSDVLLGRNGGDEFCVLIPNCTYEDANIGVQGVQTR